MHQLKKPTIKTLLFHPKLKPFRDVAIFAVLLLSFHYIYLYWASNSFYPFREQVDQLFVFASDILFNQSAWIVKHIFNLNHTTEAKQSG